MGTFDGSAHQQSVVVQDLDVEVLDRFEEPGGEAPPKDFERMLILGWCWLHNLSITNVYGHPKLAWGQKCRVSAKETSKWELPSNIVVELIMGVLPQEPDGPLQKTVPLRIRLIIRTVTFLVLLFHLILRPWLRRNNYKSTHCYFHTFQQISSPQ